MVTLSDIQAAHNRIAKHVVRTPCAYSEALSRRTGCQLYLKLENLQITGSFKERGALNKVLQLSPAQKKAGIIAASAGNHAQGVAHAARLAGAKAIIVMPENAPLTKIEGTRALGAEVVLAGTGYDQACEEARQLQKTHGYVLVHAFDDPEVIAGQGTIGLELLQQVPDLDVAVVPVGGGGLIAGIATALKQLQPRCRIIGVETERLPAMQASLEKGRVQRLPAADTLADGISVARVGDLTFSLVRQHVEGLVTVSEEQIANAILVLLEREKTLAEGAGAAGLAALLKGRIGDIRGRKVAVVVSGGNIDMNLLARILERGLETDGRLTRIRLIAPDKSRSLADIASILADQGANILAIEQARPVTDVELGQVELSLTLETKGWDHVGQIVTALRAVPDYKVQGINGTERGHLG